MIWFSCWHDIIICKCSILVNKCVHSIMYLMRVLFEADYTHSLPMIVYYFQTGNNKIVHRHPYNIAVINYQKKQTQQKKYIIYIFSYCDLFYNMYFGLLLGVRIPPNPSDSSPVSATPWGSRYSCPRSTAALIRMTKHNYKCICFVVSTYVL